jgi:hypothetical protein
VQDLCGTQFYREGEGLHAAVYGMNNIFCQVQLCNKSEACEYGCGWEMGDFGDGMVLFP